MCSLRGRGCVLACLLLSLGCSRTSASEFVPVAKDDEGRKRLWASCPKVIHLDVAGADLDLTLRDATREAVQAWNVTLGPKLQVTFVGSRTMSEDGHSTIHFVPVGYCSSTKGGRGTDCAPGSWEGLTSLYGRPKGQFSETVEVDIRLNRDLLETPRRLTEVLVHEIGHLYGLDHVERERRESGSVMLSVPPRQSRPGVVDLETVNELYAQVCESR